MINWLKKIYSEGRYGFWSIMFLFPIPLLLVLLDVFILDLENEINYGWFFVPFIFFGFLHERELKKKEDRRRKSLEEFEFKRKNRK